ncbi:MAG TPA: V-type ATPase subunit [Clostridiales bacterium]|nr:V-type ATPase subunit [Clostridiales bacterium]
MRETEYVYAVARVRVNELGLLTPSDFEQLIQSKSYEDAASLLAQKGWPFTKDQNDYLTVIEAERKKTWSLLSEIAPDLRELDALIISNDFQNLKAAIKSFFTKEDISGLMAEPTVYPAEEVLEAVKLKEFDKLPHLLRDPAVLAYEAVVKLESGRLADMALDKATLNAAIKLAQEVGSEALTEIAMLNGAVANVNIAYRSAAIGKGADFMLNAMCETDLVDNEELISAALEDRQKLVSYVSGALGEKAGSSLEEGLTAFEKWHDERLLELVEKAKYTAFGLAPICAYFIVREIELKNVRIILQAKQNGFSQDIIRQRVRLSNVNI